MSGFDSEIGFPGTADAPVAMVHVPDPAEDLLQPIAPELLKTTALEGWEIEEEAMQHAELRELLEGDLDCDIPPTGDFREDELCGGFFGGDKIHGGSCLAI